MQDDYNIYQTYVDRLQSFRQTQSCFHDVQQLIPHAIALIPLSILEYLDHKGLLFAASFDGEWHANACICINYYSRIAPGQRFDIAMDDGRPLRTFCLRENNGWKTASSGERLTALYDGNDIFVRLLDCFYESAAVRDGSFSMKAYIESLSESDRRLRAYYLIDEREYKQTKGGVAFWLSSHFPLRKRTYDSYARFYQAAAGMETDGKEEIYQQWDQGVDKEVWKERHAGKWFCQYNIPVSDVDGRVIANIMIPCLLSKETVDGFNQEVFHIAQEAGHCVREIWLYESSARLKETAVRLAASSVMSRNLSHNFGSHVLSKLSRPEPSAFSIGKESPYQGSFADVSEEPFHQVAWFNAYLRNRMDYISDVAYCPPSFLTTRQVKKDLLFGLDRTRLMLNHISGLEQNFRFNLDVRFDFEDPSCSDLEVAVPNDVIGAQALYNIVENVVRNVAKHSNSQMALNTFTLRFSEPVEANAEGLYLVRIYHNLVLSREEASDFVEMMNGFIENDVIDKRDNSLRGEALGVIEMKVSAAVLRQEDVKLVSPDYPCDPPLIKAVAIPSGEDGIFYVGYAFYVLKPIAYLVVTRETWADFRRGLLHGVAYHQDFLVFDEIEQSRIDAVKKRYGTALPLRLLKKTDFGERPINVKTCWEVWGEHQRSGWRISRFSSTIDHGVKHAGAVLLSHKVKTVAKELPPYLEALSSKACSFLPGYAAVGDLSEYVGLLERGNMPADSFVRCLEFVNTTVYVVDERFQETNTLSAAGVACPSPAEVNLRAPRFDSHLCSRLLEMIEKRMKDTDFVVIHFGLLERIFKARETKDRKWDGLMKEQIDRWIAEGTAQLVVESGRGVPKNLPDSVRFLSNASLSTAIEDIKSKSLLNALLYSSRKAKI